MSRKKAPRMRSSRAARRQAVRDADKLGALREKLLSLEPGGSPARPIEVASAAVIEPHALGTPCARCESSVRIEEHAARSMQGMRLREVIVMCSHCAHRRSVWFRLTVEGKN